MSVQIDTFDDALRIANDQLDDICSGAEKLVGGLDGVTASGQILGETLGSGFSFAKMQLSDLTDMVDEAGPALTAFAAGLSLSMNSWAQSAIEKEGNLARLAVATGDDIGLVTATMQSEMQRLDYLFTEDRLAQWSLPVFAMLPGQAENVAKLIEPLDNALVKAGGDAQSATMGWLAISNAVNGSYEMLTKASRRLRVALVTGEPALAKLKEITSDRAPAENLKSLVEAFNLSDSMKTTGMEKIFGTAQTKIRQLQGAYEEFKESAGDGFLKKWFGDLAEWARPAVEEMGASGDAIARFSGILESVVIPVGLIAGLKVLDAMLIKIGLSASGALVPLLGIVAVAASGIIILEEMYRLAAGKEGYLTEITKPWLPWVGFNEQVDASTAASRKLYESSDPGFLADAKSYGVSADEYMAMVENRDLWEKNYQMTTTMDKFAPLWFQRRGEFGFTDTSEAATDLIGATPQRFTVEMPMDEYQNIVDTLGIVHANMGLDTIDSALADAVQSAVRNDPNAAPLFMARGSDIVDATATLPFPEDLTPEQSASGTVPVSVTLSVSPGAITVTNADDPNAVADKILEMLKTAAVQAVEQELRGSVEEQARGKAQ
ncbi:MAG: hypothetical protein NTX23_08355 [Candidatus Bipolaricaulota bacterium]|nr:hypothetical protein [Candidatus Bipolaricaulota bacterium]